jgi:alkylation response protein AidB-like acyl-CoA dehydrogenase
VSVTVDILTTARELGERFAEEASERDRDRTLPRAEVDELRGSGLTTLFVPAESGGLGGTTADFMRVVELLAAGDPSIAQLFLVHCFFSRHLIDGTSGAVHAQWCRRLVDDRVFVGNAASEIGTKTALDLKTVVCEGSDGQLVVRGKKFYSTGSLPADVIGVLALRPGEGPDGEPAFCTAYVYADAPGVTIHDDWYGMGQRTTSSGTVEFDDVPIVAGSALDASVYEAPDSPFGLQAQGGFAAIYSGIATAALRVGVQWTREKARPSPVSGVDRVGDDPYTLLRIGESSTIVSSAQAMVQRMAEVVERFDADPNEHSRAMAALAVAEAKSHTGTVALEMSERLFHTAGASASVEKYNLSRFWRDARTLTIHDPVDYKYRMIGDYLINDTMPPATALS